LLLIIFSSKLRGDLGSKIETLTLARLYIPLDWITPFKMMIRELAGKKRESYKLARNQTRNNG